MSDAVELAGESGGGDRPAKKQKHNEIVAFGGPMDDEETARKKLEEVGFDPDRPVDSVSAIPIEGYADDDYLPMSYFCAVGDLMMCRYLLSKGASTTQNWVDDYDDDDESKGGNLYCSPIFAAARGGHLDICKWLCEYGARGDIRLINDFHDSPLSNAIRKIRYEDEGGRLRQICRWLILNEALCPDDDGVVCADHIEEAFGGYSDDTIFLRNWARDAIAEHDNFLVFLMGTFPHAQFTTEELRKLLNQKLRSPNSTTTIMESLSEDQQLSLWNSEQRPHSIVQCLSGHPGIRKHIADMIGVVRGRDLRILRGLERAVF